MSVIPGSTPSSPASHGPVPRHVPPWPPDASPWPGRCARPAERLRSSIDYGSNPRPLSGDLRCAYH
jgi:hypothetical protein